MSRTIDKSSQRSKVLEYMNKYGSITPIDAFRDLYITRLSAIIFNLKHEGFNINTEIVWNRNNAGRITRYARYSLGEDE